MIINLIEQLPAQYESVSNEYKGYKKRTILFLDNWVDAQFLEINGKIINGWKRGDKITSSYPETFGSFNCSLIPRNFITIYHNSNF